MEYKQLKNGFRLPVLGLGTWTIGGNTEPDYSKDKESIAAIKKAIELGYIHIDTAESYGGGHCEELVGEAIKGFDRKKLFITTKVTASHLAHDEVIAAAKRSLKRLGTDYIDLYLIHAPNPEVPLVETISALNFLIIKGMVKNVGVSNFTMEQLKEAVDLSEAPIVANQIEYSLLTRNVGKYAGNFDMERKTVPYCQKNDVIIMAERPVERGLLAKSHPVLDRLSKKYGKTNSQIAINWLLSKKNVVTIPKSTSEEHLKENLGAIGWKMDRADQKLLDETRFD